MQTMSSEEMCSFFYQGIGSTVQGDLGDIVRGGGGGGGGLLPSYTDDVTAVPDDSIGEEFTKMAASPLPAASLVDHSHGVKRRKGQAKRVICIPAPASSDQDSKSSGGVVVPSDLWAWRKYGQKPIKGSPYPRGYYRCSSSKGCSARKQVERSRSDPNMLVITYTSEHNHPWPTHRNSLAGCARSQPPKGTQKDSNKHASSRSNTKQEGLDDHMSLSSSNSPLDQDMGFFDELGGLEPDPMGFFSSRELKLGGEGKNKAILDPLSYFDWDVGNY